MSTLSTNETPEQYFDRLNAERGIIPSFALPRTVEEQRARVSIALGNYYQHASESPDLGNYLAKIPENVRGIARAFCDGFGRTPFKRENAFWRSEWNNQVQIGLQPGDITEAIKEMFKKDLTIKSPRSVTAIAENIKRRRIEQKSTLQRGVTYYSPASEKYVGGNK